MQSPVGRAVARSHPLLPVRLSKISRNASVLVPSRIFLPSLLLCSFPSLFLSPSSLGLLLPLGTMPPHSHAVHQLWPCLDTSPSPTGIPGSYPESHSSTLVQVSSPAQPRFEPLLLGPQSRPASLISQLDLPATSTFPRPSVPKNSPVLSLPIASLAIFSRSAAVASPSQPTASSVSHVSPPAVPPALPFIVLVEST